MNTEEKVIYSRQVVEFAASANEFCKYLEGTKDINGIEILKVMQRILPFIYLRASLLPLLDPLLEDANEKTVTEFDWTRMHDNLLSKIGNNDPFPVVVTTGDPSDGLYTGSIAESLTDVYQDLKDFIVSYKSGNEEVMNDAIWEVLMNFEEFWGRKLLNVLLAIHTVLYSEAEEKDENDKPGDDDTV
ncbi:MAG: DUF5063 domain-containing protein [Bacteroidales bacterium]|jgi:hypothetical protein|nr:DUF5063 domain-containing protein [Bacteroidales bacterium]